MATLDLAQIQHRRDTAANWVVANPVLASGEKGIETDTHLEKLGDGVTLWNSLGYMPEQLAKQITSAADKPTPVDADEIPLADSAASFGLKSLTWANLVATLKTYFDTLYATVSGYIANTLLSATGDMIYASSANTPARLPKGNTGDVMTQGATIPGWAAPAGGGCILLKRATFSNVADTGTTFDGFFTTAYTEYLVIIEKWISTTAADDPVMQLLYSGTTQAASYYGATNATNISAVSSAIGNSNLSSFTFWTTIGGTNGTSLSLWFSNVGNGSDQARWHGTGYEGDTPIQYVTGGSVLVSQTYTGFLLKSSAGNISGTVSIYGLAKV